MQPTSRQDPRRRSDRCSIVDNEDPSTRAVSFGASVRGLDWLDAQESFDRWQDQAWRHNPGWRRDLAQRVGGWGHCRNPTSSNGGRGSPWLVDLLKRKPAKLAAVALANK